MSLNLLGLIACTFVTSSSAFFNTIVMIVGMLPTRMIGFNNSHVISFFISYSLPQIHISVGASNLAYSLRKTTKEDNHDDILAADNSPTALAARDLYPQ